MALHGFSETGPGRQNCGQWGNGAVYPILPIAAKTRFISENHICASDRPGEVQHSREKLKKDRHKSAKIGLREDRQFIPMLVDSGPLRPGDLVPWDFVRWVRRALRRSVHPFQAARAHFHRPGARGQKHAALRVGHIAASGALCRLPDGPCVRTVPTRARRSAPTQGGKIHDHWYYILG